MYTDLIRRINVENLGKIRQQEKKLRYEIEQERGSPGH